MQFPQTKSFVFVLAALAVPAFLTVSRAADAVMSNNSGSSAGASAPAKSAPAAKAEDPKGELNKQITDAIAFYNTLEAKPETAIPNWVVQKAKGVIIISRWSAGVGIGGTGGYGLGWKRVGGAFTGPAFYSLGGATLGAQIGVSKSLTISFLMSDKSLPLLTDDKMMWSGNLKAVAGKYDASDDTGQNGPDVIIFQQTSGFDVGAFVSGVQISVDNDANRKFYDNATVTPTDIFSGKVKTPEITKAFEAALEKQIKAAAADK
jgi:lipid-binding SYLF domain-containing protein